MKELVSFSCLSDPVVLCHQHFLIENFFRALKHVLLEELRLLIRIFYFSIQSVPLKLSCSQGFSVHLLVVEILIFGKSLAFYSSDVLRNESGVFFILFVNCQLYGVSRLCRRLSDRFVKPGVVVSSCILSWSNSWVVLVCWVEWHWVVEVILVRVVYILEPWMSVYFG